MNLYESIKSNLKESDEDRRKKQLINNIEALVYEYDNGINDGVSEPFKSEDELVDYVYSQIFDMKDNGEGSTRYADGICDDLKYLGRDYIVSEIKRIGNEAGVVQNLNEAEKYSYTVICKDKSGKGLSTIKGKIEATSKEDAKGKVHELLTIDKGYKTDDIKKVAVKSLNEAEENRFYAQNKLNKLFNKLEDIDFADIDKGNAEFDAIMKEIEAFVKENDITEKEFNDVIQYYKNGFDFSGYNFKDWFKKEEPKKEEKVEEHREIRTPRSTPYDRTRAAVYATGNRWAIENFNATHN